MPDPGGRPARFELAGLTVDVATAFGPRIVGLATEESGNLLAVLPDATLPGPDGRPYRLRGGHRLWIAPETIEITYRPDDDPVVVDDSGDRVAVVGALDPATGLRRTIELRAAAGDGGIRVSHRVRNEGAAPRRLAAWAITQLPLGGHARLPLTTGPGDPAALRPDRLLVLWPYTSLADARLEVRDDAVLVAATPGRRLKVGSAARGAAVAYRRHGWTFAKRADGATGEGGAPASDASGAVDGSAAAFADLGAVVQVFCDASFAELETLGPLVDLAPGDETTHDETWTVGRDDG